MTKGIPATLPLNKLHIDPMNVRRHRGEVEPEFIASIAHRGVDQALQVRPHGDGHSVFAGGKRLEALQALAKAGKFAADYAVKVEIFEGLTDAEAREQSLVENFVRADMHPVDEYRAFVDMHSDKSAPIDAEQIAARFGLDRLYVEQRLALGALDTKILDAWLADEVDEDTAEAFTLCPSKKAQVAIYDQLKKSGGLTPFAVRRALKADHENPGRYLDFVGADDYEKRGGKITRDLFGKNHIVSDAKLMMAMVAEKQDSTVQQLLADGWAFVIQRPNDAYSYGQLEPKAKIPKELTDALKAAEKKLDALQRQDEYESDDEDKLQEEVAAIEAKIAPIAYTAEQKAKAGCFVSLNSDGGIEIVFGQVKPSQKKTVAATERKGDTAQPAAPKPSEAKVISNALRDRLSDQLVEATKKALKADTTPAGLPTILKDLVAGMIGGYGTPDAVRKALPAIRDAITPKVINEAIRKEFDRADYFGNAPIPVLLAAITEAVNADEARKLKGKKKGDVAKFAAANVGKTTWLPKELRTASYDGPGTKTGKTPAKKSK